MTVARPQEGELDLGIACYAEIVFDQNRLARISPPTDGITRSVRVDLGDRVAPGEVLATMSSAAIGDAVSRAVLAHQTVERERALRAQRVSSEKDLQVAEASYRASQQELRTMGFDEGQIRDFVSHSTDLDALELRAPFAGEIVERSAVLGEMVEAGTALFTIADRSTMWAMLSLPERDLSRARVGQTVEIRVDAIPHRHFSGRLAWISARVDDRTRMTQARAEIADPERLLSDRMFATARILTGRSAPGMLVPASALHHIDDRDFVFVKLEEDLYEARRVDVGGAADGLVAVARGLGPDEAVVVEGGFLARSQFLISKLGAGCAD
jgi:cobalt-zinc-cadmium efflux system membrane fusion protein